MDENKKKDEERKSVLDLPPRVVRSGKALNEGERPYLRTNGQIRTDRIDVAKLYVQGRTTTYSVAWIDDKRPYNYTEAMFLSDKKTVFNEWREMYLPDIDAIKSNELARLDALIAEAWQAWDASKEPKEVTESELATSKPAGSDKQFEETKSKHKQENRDGNPKFLEVIQKLMNQRAKILGIHAPQRHEIKDWRKEAEEMGIDPAKTFEKLVQEEMKKLD
jgi:hypothetical protein